jgi:hypothetical protein
MNIETVKKGHDILEEIESLKKYNKLLNNNEHRHVTHFEIVQHFGECRDFEKIVIEKKHNQRLLSEIDKIIKELESQLAAL